MLLYSEAQTWVTLTELAPPAPQERRTRALVLSAHLLAPERVSDGMRHAGSTARFGFTGLYFATARLGPEGLYRGAARFRFAGLLTEAARFYPCACGGVPLNSRSLRLQPSKEGALVGGPEPDGAHFFQLTFFSLVSLMSPL